MKITFEGSMTGTQLITYANENRPDNYVRRIAALLGAIWNDNVTYYYGNVQQDRIAPYIADETMCDTIADMILKMTMSPK